MARMEAGGTLWGLGLALLCVLLTHDILTNRKHSWVPSALTTLAAAAVSANFGWLLFVHQSEGDAEGGKDHTFLGMVLLLSLLALGSSFALMVRQVQEAVVDKADLKKLEQVLRHSPTPNPNPTPNPTPTPTQPLPQPLPLPQPHPLPQPYPYPYPYPYPLT